ncbi:hypothetical protein AAFF_G00256790 [Aldrovandia affinis]|uniref:Uncharacterized protein n=1 Tax=Aldrovandia affinis TaxID=143900 RepID=A0AAD7STE2_9TELE|nr:hypothetical protein AAFF_G00256790 [Aldrovandia affinis]
MGRGALTGFAGERRTCGSQRHGTALPKKGKQLSHQRGAGRGWEGRGGGGQRSKECRSHGKNNGKPSVKDEEGPHLPGVRADKYLAFLGLGAGARCSKKLEKSSESSERSQRPPRLCSTCPFPLPPKPRRPAPERVVCAHVHPVPETWENRYTAYDNAACF